VANFKNRKGISQREFAKRLGVSSAAISSAILTGRIQTLEDKSIDYESQKISWEQNGDQNKKAAYQKHKDNLSNGPKPDKFEDPDFIKKCLAKVENGTASPLESKYVKDLFEARTEILKYKEKRGETVSKKLAESILFSIARGLRDQLYSSIEDLSYSLESKKQKEIRSILRTEIDKVLSNIQPPDFK